MRFSNNLPVFVLALVAAAWGGGYEAPDSPDRAEAGSVEAIAGLTTSLRFLPPAVAYLPAAPGVPSPARGLGHLAGAPEIARSADVHRYLRQLAAASDRVRVQAAGTSEEGREILLVMVSEAHNLAEIGYFRQSAARLADPRQTSRAEAERLADIGKLCYYVVGGTQPGEIASPEMLAELAYRLAVSNQPALKAVRQNAIVLITPVAEPDAYDRAVEWYRRHLRQRRDLPWTELRDILMPPYSGHYGGAGWAALDDRGGALASTRAVAEAFFDFHPQLVQGLGLAAPLLSLDAGTTGPAAGGPAAVRGEGSADLAGGADPWPPLTAAVAAALRQLGMPGIELDGNDAGDAAAVPGSRAVVPPAVALAREHDAAGGVIGVFGNRAPGTYERQMGELEPPAAPSEAAPPGRQPPRPERQSGHPRQRPPRLEALPAPSEGWPPGGRSRWSLRDAVNYAESATLEALSWAAGHRRQLLLGRWQRGDRDWRRGSEEAPYAWIFPARQADPGRLAGLVRDLLWRRIEVSRLRDDLLLGSQHYAAGSYVVRLDQPRRQAALHYLAGAEAAGPDGGLLAGSTVPWTLIYGVESHRIERREVLAAPMEPVTAPAPVIGRIDGDEPPFAPASTVLDPAAPAAAAGEIFLLRDTGQTSLLAARLALGSYQVDAAEVAFRAGGTRYPAGSWIVQAPRARVRAVAERLGLTLAASPALPEVRRHVVHLPRLAVLHGWADAEPSGWVRFALDREGAPYALIDDEDLRRGGLRQRFDVILFAGGDRDWRRQLRGIDPKWSPLAYTRTADFPSHGLPDGAADLTAGAGEGGLQALKRFVEGGGVLVTLGEASALAAGAGLAPGLAAGPTVTPPADPATAGPPAALEPPAPLEPPAELRAHFVQPGHPLAYGYPTSSQVLRRSGPLFDLAPAESGHAVLSFGDGAPAAPAARAAGEGLGTTPPGKAAAIEVEDLDAPKSPPGSPHHRKASGTGLDGDASGKGSPDDLDAASDGSPHPLGPHDGRLLLGGRLNEDPATIAGHPAIVDLPLGRGHVVLFAFNPFDPTAGPADLRLVYNLLLHWHSLPP